MVVLRPEQPVFEFGLAPEVPLLEAQRTALGSEFVACRL